MPHPPAFRRISAFLLLFIALACGGCVYLRLLQLKGQLADFDAHFQTQTTDGLKIICREPVLITDDVRWLGADPESIRKTDTGEHWHIRWAKDRPKGEKESIDRDVDLDADFRDKQLQAITIPERYFSVFSKKLLVDLLRSTGRARIDKKDRQAHIDTSSVAAADGMGTPDRKSVEDLLGLPSERIEESNTLRYRYRYRTQTPTGPGKPIEITFVFEPKTDLLRRLIGKLPKGTLTFDFPGAPEKKSQP